MLKTPAPIEAGGKGGPLERTYAGVGFIQRRKGGRRNGLFPCLKKKKKRGPSFTQE